MNGKKTTKTRTPIDYKAESKRFFSAIETAIDALGEMQKSLKNDFQESDGAALSHLSKALEIQKTKKPKEEKPVEKKTVKKGSIPVVQLTQYLDGLKLLQLQKMAQRVRVASNGNPIVLRNRIIARFEQEVKKTGKPDDVLRRYRKSK